MPEIFNVSAKWRSYLAEDIYANKSLSGGMLQSVLVLRFREKEIFDCQPDIYNFTT